MLFDSDKRPVKISGTKDVPIRWLYRDLFIELIYVASRFIVQVRPMGTKGQAIDYVHAAWPVSEYRDQAETTRHVNRLLSGICHCIDRRTFPTCSKSSYTKEPSIITFLKSESVKHEQKPILIIQSELEAVKACEYQLV